jgi:hypothetical protein
MTGLGLEFLCDGAAVDIAVALWPIRFTDQLLHALGWSSEVYLAATRVTALRLVVLNGMKIKDLITARNWQFES